MVAAYKQNQVPFFVTDINGRVLYANSAVEQRTLFHIPEVIGKKAGALWGGKMQEIFYQNLWKKIKTDESIFISDVTNQNKSKQVLEEHLVSFPVTGEQGVCYLLGFHYAEGAHTRRVAFDKHCTDLFRSQKLKDEMKAVILGQEQATAAAPESLKKCIEEILLPQTRELFSERGADAALISAAKKDPEQFSLLFQKYYTVIFSYFLKRLKSASVAEDLTQDTFLKAYQSLESYKISNASYKTYLLRIAHNTLINQYRKREEFSLDGYAEILTDSQKGITEHLDGEYLKKKN